MATCRAASRRVRGSSPRSVTHRPCVTGRPPPRACRRGRRRVARCRPRRPATLRVRGHHEHEAERRGEGGVSGRSRARRRRRAVPSLGGREPPRDQGDGGRRATRRTVPSAGVPGERRSGRSTSARIVVGVATSGRGGGGSRRRRRARVAVSSTGRTTAPARPPSSGWAKATSGTQRRTPCAVEVDAREERRGGRERLDGGADVVKEAREGQRLRTAPASGRVAAPSRTSTARPATRELDAAARPFGPERRPRRPC